jgi:hypothetical protein
MKKLCALIVYVIEVGEEQLTLLCNVVLLTKNSAQSLATESIMSMFGQKPTLLKVI